jgi:hypothetical protein
MRLPRAVVVPGVKLAEHAGSEKAVTVTAPDSEGKPELLCLRLGNAESACPPAAAATAASHGCAPARVLCALCAAVVRAAQRSTRQP